MKQIMVSGNFDPFTFAHLDYIKKASKMGGMPTDNFGNVLVCVVSSDEQVMMKKGKVNEPENERREILHLILKGLEIPHAVFINHFDKYTTLVAETLRKLRPDVFCRGSDKTIEDMPEEERLACEDYGIKIVHIQSDKIAHGSVFV